MDGPGEELCQLVFEGPADQSAETIRKLKGVLIADLNFSIEETAHALEHFPVPLKQAPTIQELARFRDAVKRAGGLVHIVAPPTPPAPAEAAKPAPKIENYEFVLDLTEQIAAAEEEPEEQQKQTRIFTINEDTNLEDVLNEVTEQTAHQEVVEYEVKKPRPAPTQKPTETPVPELAETPTLSVPTTAAAPTAPAAPVVMSASEPIQFALEDSSPAAIPEATITNPPPDTIPIEAEPDANLAQSALLGFEDRIPPKPPLNVVAALHELSLADEPVAPDVEAQLPVEDPVLSAELHLEPVPSARVESALDAVEVTPPSNTQLEAEGHTNQHTPVVAPRPPSPPPQLVEIAPPPSLSTESPAVEVRADVAVVKSSATAKPRPVRLTWADYAMPLGAALALVAIGNVLFFTVVAPLLSGTEEVRRPIKSPEELEPTSVPEPAPVVPVEIHGEQHAGEFLIKWRGWIGGDVVKSVQLTVTPPAPPDATPEEIVANIPHIVVEEIALDSLETKSSGPLSIVATGVARLSIVDNNQHRRATATAEVTARYDKISNTLIGDLKLNNSDQVSARGWVVERASTPERGYTIFLRLKF